LSCTHKNYQLFFIKDYYKHFCNSHQTLSYLSSNSKTNTTSKNSAFFLKDTLPHPTLSDYFQKKQYINKQYLSTASKTMLTEKSLKFFGQALNLLSVLGISPFHYDVKTGNITHLINYYRLAFFLAQVTHQFCYLLLLGVNLIVCVKQITTKAGNKETKNKPTYAEIFWLVLFFGGVLWSFFSIVCAWLRRRDLVVFFNSITNYTKTPNIKSRLGQDY